MPIYEYACRACGHQFEEWQKISDKPIRTCPVCKKRRVEKLMSMSSFQLKGGGWYADGYASAKGSSSAEKATGSSTADGAKSKGDGSSGDSTPTKKKASKQASSSSSSDTKAA